jgi:PAS domain S-box-containing protein
MSIKDWLEIPVLQDLFDSYYRISGFSTAILDLEGQIMVASGWQPICTQFHRKHPTTASRCLESDTALAGKLAKGEKYNIYKCKNGLVDVAVPIIVDEIHVGNLFAGQFLLTPPDLDYFTQQAAQFGFDQDSYLAALEKVPVFPMEKIRQSMEFLTTMTTVIGNSGIAKNRQMELNRHLEERIQERTADLRIEINNRERAEIELQKSKQFSDALINSLPGVFFVFDQMGHQIRWNKNLEAVLGYSAEQIKSMRPLDFVTEEDKEGVRQAIAHVFAEGTTQVEARLSTIGGEIIPYLFTGFNLVQDNFNYVVGVGMDISERISTEKEKENLIRKLQNALAEVKQLSGLLPICASCKKVRDDDGYWGLIETYIRNHSQVEFSHGICPDCARKLYPNLDLFKTE